MGEQPIFSTKAHVFQIDPDTKKKWLPSSTQAVPVSFYHDSVRSLYRIISVEAAKVDLIIQTYDWIYSNLVTVPTLVPAMVFTKTSQKFGQWSDLKANTVYGIGFASEIDLTKFMEKFQEVKEFSRDSSTSPQPGVTDLFSGLHINNGSGDQRDGRASPLVAKPASPSPDITARRRYTSSRKGTEQLKYENDRLKIALAQSSANAKKWETELATLRSNNAKLLTAMNQSEVNVKQWSAQLANYREENGRLQKQLSELELSALGGADQVRRDLVETKIKLNEMEQLYSEKHKQLFDCESKLNEIRQVEAQHESLKTKNQSTEEENQRLRRDVADLTSQLERAKRGAGNKRELSALQEQLSTKINELYVMNDRLADLLQTNND